MASYDSTLTIEYECFKTKKRNGGEKNDRRKRKKVTVTRNSYERLDNELYLFELMLNTIEILIGRFIKKYNAPNKCIELSNQISNSITCFILTYNSALPILDEIGSQITIPVSTLGNLVKDTTEIITSINQSINDFCSTLVKGRSSKVNKQVSNLKKDLLLPVTFQDTICNIVEEILEKSR